MPCLVQPPSHPSELMTLAATQIELDLFSEPSRIPVSGISNAIESLAVHGDVEARGAVFTRSEVVEFILDLPSSFT
jgi:hypothetical protein